jgi:hypothetical protein
MNLSKEDQSLGGRTAQSKVYYCENCCGIGKGSQMINNHFIRFCEGKQGRKLKKSTDLNAHRLEEAILNTKIWEAEQDIKHAAEVMKAQKDSALSHIEELRKISKEFLGDGLLEYYSKIF